MKMFSNIRVEFKTTEDEAPTFIKTVGLERTFGGGIAIFASKDRDDYIHREIPRDEFIEMLKALGFEI